MAQQDQVDAIGAAPVRSRATAHSGQVHLLDTHSEHSLVYPLLTTIIAVSALIALGLTGQFYWSPTLTFLAVGCIFAEWLVIRLPEGNSLTTSIIFVLLALVFDSGQVSPEMRAVGALQIIAIGSLVGHGLVHRLPVLTCAFYASQYIWASTLAGIAFAQVSQRVPSLWLSSFHWPAVTAYVTIFSLVSTLLVSFFNRRIIKGNKLPKADLLYTIFLAPIALILYYFFESRGLSFASLLFLAIPLVGVLVTFRLYVNIDTTYGEVNQLYLISQELVAAMSQEETRQRVSERIAQAIALLVRRLDGCLVYAHNEESNEYVLINTANSRHGPDVIVPGHGLLGQIALEGSGGIVNDVRAGSGLGPKEEKWPHNTALLAHPMLAERRQVGLLVLVRYGKRFTSEEFRLVGIVANQAGVTLHNAQLYERTKEMADIDRQLDVLNQTGFTQRAEGIMSKARALNQPVALLYPDIDDFRIINNTFGHLAGDKVLAGVANVMKEAVDGKGIVGRSGGEEFFVLLPNAGEEDAVEMADDIRLRVQGHAFYTDDQREVRVTISTGVALFPRDAGDILSLIRQADRAAYLAKRLGKNRVCLYEDRKELIESAPQQPDSGTLGSPVQV